MGKTIASPFALQLQATRHSLEDGLRRIERYSTTAYIGKDTLSRLLIIIEELFTNTIKYGYGEECIGLVFLTLTTSVEADERTTTLIYEDAAPPFNPLNWDITASLDADPKRRPVGRTGIALILGLVHKATYELIGTLNRLTLTIHGASQGPNITSVDAMAGDPGSSV